MKNLWLAFTKVTRKKFYYHISFLLTMFLLNVTRDFFCNNSFDVKTMEFNRFHNRKSFYFTFLSNWFDWNVYKKMFLLINYLWKKVLFCNISGAIHSNNISKILILFEYFRNMYPCHRQFWKFFSKEINRLISKRMSKIYDWEKLTFSKLVGKVNFSERKFEAMH